MYNNNMKYGFKDCHYKFQTKNKVPVVAVTGMSNVYTHILYKQYIMYIYPIPNLPN